MADLVNEATAAPKQAVAFAENHLVAFLLIVVVAMLLFTFAEAQRPGIVTMKVARLPFIGPAIVKRRIA